MLAAIAALACTAGTRTVDERVSDAVITSTVQQRLATDQTLQGAAIDVATAEGVVTLVGRVSSEEHRVRAETLARSVEGVRNVRNLVRVNDLGD